MKEIEKIIREYLEASFAKDKAEFDIKVDDDKDRELDILVQEFSHSSISKNGARVTSQEEMQREGEDMLQLYSVKTARRQKKPILSIEEYSNPILGDALARIIVDNNLFTVDLGWNEPKKDPRSPSVRLYWMNTDEGWKIIYSKYFLKGSWGHGHDHQPTRVEEDGELVNKIEITDGE